MTTNTVDSRYFRGMSNDEIRERIIEEGDRHIARAFPGTVVNADNLVEALNDADGNFEVAKRPVFSAHELQKACADSDYEPVKNPTHCETYRTDTLATLGMVGVDYGIVQTLDAMQAADILAKRGDMTIVNVENIDNGRRVRVTGLLSVTSFEQASGEPNHLAHFVNFEATHDGSKSTTASVYSLRLECFNGMTSQSVVGVHKLRHTSKVGDRVEGMTKDILEVLLGDIEAETALFESLAKKKMSTKEFTEFATEFLGGELEEDASESKKTRREKAVEELTEYFIGGNQGAGATAYGAYNSVTRWIEGKREALEDAAKAAKKFDARLNGSAGAKATRALKLLSK